MACNFEAVILTDLGVFNFCTFQEKWTTMLPVEHRLAVRRARFRILAWHPREDPPLNQQRWRKWPQRMFVNNCMNGYYTKKMYAFLHKNVSYTENQSIYFQTKKVPGGEQVPPSEYKRIRRQGGWFEKWCQEAEDHFTQLYRTVMKIENSVWTICFVLYCLLICPISNNTCLPICSYWMQDPTWLSD